MASSTSKCQGDLNKANSFCYVCGDFTTVAQRRTITSLLRSAYFHYFDCKIGDHNKSRAPHICCKPCYNGRTAWFNGKKAAFNFAVPMVWRETRNNADNCKIPPRHYEDGEQLSRQTEPRHDGGLLLDVLAWQTRRQNTPDLLRKHTFDCGIMNCVIVSSKYIDSICVLYLSCFICYKLLQLLKYAHIFSVYTKMRLFKSQKTRAKLFKSQKTRAKLFINLNSALPN